MEKFNVKSPWWKKYRHAKHQPKQRLSLEMIVRRSFTEVLREYLLHCSLIGVKQVCERDIPIRHRIFWTILIIMTYGAVIYMLINIWNATLSNPLIVTMDSSTYPIADIDFPAVALCNVNRISRKSVKKMAAEIYERRVTKNRNTTLEDIEWFILQGGRLIDYSLNETLRLSLLKFVNQDSDRQIVNLMEKLAPSCDEMLVRCSWDGKEVNCSELFTMRRTVLGHCCAFNYVLKYDDKGRPEKDWKLIGKVMRQKQAGWYHGLIVVMDPLLEDYAYPLRSVQGFDVFLFDPTHFADPSGGRVLQRLVQPNDVNVLELQSDKQIATAEVRKYPLSIRKCLFRDEIPELFGDMYSYSACIARCKMKTINSLCKCTPYFLPTRHSGTTCSLMDLQCLNKYKEKLLYFYPFYATSKIGLEMEHLDSLYCPECLPDCELTKHSTKSSVIPFEDHGLGDRVFLPKIVEGLNIYNSNLAMVYIYQPTNDGVLDRLDVVSYWYEILSNVGGFAGILVGFSIISLYEIIYYFTVRFIQVMCSNWRLYH